MRAKKAGEDAGLQPWMAAPPLALNARRWGRHPCLRAGVLAGFLRPSYFQSNADGKQGVLSALIGGPNRFFHSFSGSGHAEAA